MGYADDTCVITKDLESIQFCADWVKDFIDFHKGKLNMTKTYGFNINSPQKDKDKNAIKIKDTKISLNSEQFEYLGHIVNVKGKIDDFIKKIERSKLNPILANLEIRKYPLHVIRKIYLELIIPRIENIMKYHVLPKRIIEKWNSRIYNLIKTIFEINWHKHKFERVVYKFLI